MADDLRSIFYASSRKKADELALAFAAKREKDLPSAVKCLSNSLDACLTFFSFPEEEWISLRTSNVIERLNKEFKRRTKPMEIVAGRERLLSSPGVHITEDGDELEDNKNREGMSEFAPLQEIYTIGLTVPP